MSDPACDLAIVTAILSSNFDVNISGRTAFAGEIGLSGEVRPVGQIEKRIAEAEKLGFNKIFVSAFNNPGKLDDNAKERTIEVIKIQTIAGLVRYLFK